MLMNLYERARDSLFVVPASLIAGLGAAAWGARRIDDLVSSGVPWLLVTTVDSTRSVLATVATATITVAAIVFSMTAVVVQLATSQFSPRVTQGFLRDRYQQVTIGFTVGTFVYTLLVLSDVHGTEEHPFSDHDFSTTLAVLLGVVSMILIVSFIDRIMRSMRIDTIIRRLADETEKSINRLPDRDPATDKAGAPLDSEGVSSVIVARTGWVSQIDVDSILALVPAQAVVRLDLKVGDFIIHDEVAARVWPAVDAATSKGIARAISVGRARTIETDPSYGIRQLVDIALRALSPSLNDATTASDVIRHLGGPVQTILLRSVPGQVVKSQSGTRIYLPRAMTHSDYVHAAFREIRLNSEGQPYALQALIETLASLIDVVEGAGHLNRSGALRNEVDATVAMIRRSDLPAPDATSLLDFASSLGIVEKAD